jgi:hypothetical protein
LNTFSSTDKRVVGLADTIMHDGADWHYPVFVSWPSNAPGTWAENTFRLREGRKTGSPWLGIATSPFILASDALSAVADYPATVYYQLTNEKDRLASVWRLDRALSTIWKEADDKYCGYEAGDGQRPAECGHEPVSAGGTIVLNRSRSHPNTPGTYARNTLQAVTLPVRITVGTLYNGAFANSMWDNMKRRTRNVYYPPQLFDSRERERGNVGLPGGEFFRLLLDRIRLDSAHAWDVTLVGHSMGTIVINQALGIYQEDWLATGALTDIVYMAAACSIEDALTAIAPMLRGIPEPESSLGSPGRAANFHNLTLNRIAEVAETHAGGLIPTGSLLVSIDQHLEKPGHPLGRTLGSEVNVLSMMNIISEELQGIRGRAVFKSFDRHPGKVPEAHGDFNKVAFWKRDVWSLDSPDQTSVREN